MNALRRTAFALLAVTVAAGCRPNDVPPTAATPRPIVEMPTPDPNAKPGDVSVYRVRMDQDGSTLEARRITVAGDTDPERARAALNAMTDGDDSPFPAGTQIRSVQIEGDLATVDLNGAFQKKFEGGDLMEALAVNAIAATVGQFTGVKRVQILVEGKKIPTLGGGQTLDQPVAVPAP